MDIKTHIDSVDRLIEINMPPNLNEAQKELYSDMVRFTSGNIQINKALIAADKDLMAVASAMLCGRLMHSVTAAAFPGLTQEFVLDAVVRAVDDIADISAI